MKQLDIDVSPPAFVWTPYFTLTLWRVTLTVVAKSDTLRHTKKPTGDQLSKETGGLAERV